MRPEVNADTLELKDTLSADASSHPVTAKNVAIDNDMATRIDLSFMGLNFRLVAGYIVKTKMPPFSGMATILIQK